MKLMQWAKILAYSSHQPNVRKIWNTWWFLSWVDVCMQWMCHHWELEQNTSCYSKMMTIITLCQKKNEIFQKILINSYWFQDRIDNAIKRLKSDKGDAWAICKINNYLIDLAYGIKVIFYGGLILVSFSHVETTVNRCAHLTKSVLKLN